MDRIAAARQAYAEELRFVAHIRSEAVVRAFATVPRERFLGPPPWRVLGEDRSYWTVSGDDPVQAYHNILFALDETRELNNGQPQFLAGLFDLLDIRPWDTVFHIGAGVGYYTAILAELASQGHVIGAEVDPELAQRAQENLAERNNVAIVAADGASYDPGPVDVIFVNAGATHPLPGWLAALNPGGRLMLPLTTERWDGIVVQIVRIGTGASYAAKRVSGVGIYPCTSARNPTVERALARALGQGGARFIRSLRLDAHVAQPNCWLHGDGFCLSTDPIS